MILSIIIPVYNEEKTLLKSLESVKKLGSNLKEHEIKIITQIFINCMKTDPEERKMLL